MARNTTGLAQPEQYALGRGKVFYAAIDSTTGKPDDSGWRFMGNCPAFSVTIEREALEHESSQSGLKVTDKTVTQKLSVSLQFDLDEINDENLALWSAGETATHTNPAIAGFSANVITDAAVLGRWYDIVNSAGERAYDIDATKLTVRRDPSGTPATLVKDTDYTVDTKMGRIFLLTTSGTVVDGDEVDVALSADAGASPVYEVRALTSSDLLSGALKFIQENPANGDKQREYQFHTVDIAPDGDFSLIGDDWATLSFSGSVQKNELADIDAPYYRVRDHALS